MKVMITAKNYKPSERLQDNIEKKFSKLEKFFDEDVTANVIVSKFKDKTKLEATINTKQTPCRRDFGQRVRGNGSHHRPTVQPDEEVQRQAGIPVQGEQGAEVRVHSGR